MTKQKTVYRIILSVFSAAFIVAACNNKSGDKGASKDSTTNTMNKMDSANMKKMDTGMNKMDTAATRPVKEGN